MALTKYELLVGSSAADLQSRVRTKQSTGSIIVYGMFQRGGYYCQAVGNGTLDVGMLTDYQIVSSPNIETFTNLVTSMLDRAQPLGTPVVYNSALFQVMGKIQAFNMSGQNGADGKTPQIQVANGNIQWKYTTDTTWQNLVSLSSLQGASADMRVTNSAIQWKRSTDSTWTTLIGLDQITGPAGVQGPEGPTGSTGPQGPSGQRGPTGDTGPAGETGPQGLPGPMGPQGNPGNTGPQGPQGNMSAQGPVGPKGETGSTGATGPQGVAGLTGATGTAGTNSVVETLSGTVVTAGTAVPLIFTKTYSAPPVVIPVPQWNGTQMITGGASNITRTGCSFTAMQSRGTLLLTSGPFENAAAGVVFRVLVIGN